MGYDIPSDHHGPMPAISLIAQWAKTNPDFHRAMEHVADEIAAARSKFPPMHSAHEGYAVILEELDELWQEVQRSQKEPRRNLAMRNEAKQVAAMAIAFMVEICE